jgi:hypothetical protein
MPRIVGGFQVGTSTPERVIRENGLSVTVEELVDAAAKHDNTNPGYLSTDELQHGADDLKAALNVTGTTTFDYSANVLAALKAQYVPSASDQQLVDTAAQWDDGNGYLKKSELEAGAMELQITSSGRALSASDIASIRTWTGCERKGSTTSSEIGVVSDIDKTLMPPERQGQAPPPYPGVSTLFRLLEFGAQGNGQPGDVTYVTARNPGRVTDVPAWLSTHNLPAGNIETGTDPRPWIAEDEKVADIERVFLAHPNQEFILFGDTNHRDPDVYRRIREKFPTQVKAVIMHNVKTVDAARLVGHNVVNNYAEAAAVLLKLRVLDEASARSVMNAAKNEGLAITTAEIDSLIQTHKP